MNELSMTKNVRSPEIINDQRYALKIYGPLKFYVNNKYNEI